MLVYLAVVDWVVDRNIPLESDGHRHEDGTGDGDRQQRVQEVGEHEHVDDAHHVQPLPEGLQDAPDQVARVHADQGDQQEVERVSHVLSENKKINQFINVTAIFHRRFIVLRKVKPFLAFVLTLISLGNFLN